MYKGVSANVDFYSGLIYEMLGIQRDLFIPIFAAARTVGWIAHEKSPYRSMTQKS